MVASAAWGDRHPSCVLAAFVLALGATAACGGKAIHLGNGRDGAPTACTPAHVNANEVLWIGDSWILVTGDEHTRVRDLARAAGAIGPERRLRHRRRGRRHHGRDRESVRDAGGGRDQGQGRDHGRRHLGHHPTGRCVASDVATPSASSSRKVASDGTVEHIVYFLPPEIPAIPGVAALRPLLQQACAASTVPCHFLDLQPLWSVHPEYTDANLGFLPTVDGSRAVGDAIWTVMQQNCIAQVTFA